MVPGEFKGRREDDGATKFGVDENEGGASERQGAGDQQSLILQANIRA